MEALLGQCWRGLECHSLALCVVECCMLQGLPVVFFAALVTSENPDASLDLFFFNCEYH